ncbi:hypothetical protein NLJ89_g7907 [Agrocybe chaxingu]|uniref:Uncharacterized protein n=1 Tax=Agrocybe chaxingu TaxID=84603 RepID=A0A9W8K3H0_9AGAR|nr:hypothetical protein NLJ89_g7907 [Agrocybe chaxingu]
MVRGGAFDKGGVSGNVGIVTRARRLVYAYLSEAGGGTGGSDVEVWEEKVFGMSVDEKAQERAIAWDKENAAQAGPKGIGVGIGGRDSLDSVGLENAIVKIDGSKKPLPPFVCPKCKSAV